MNTFKRLRAINSWINSNYEVTQEEYDYLLTLFEDKEMILYRGIDIATHEELTEQELLDIISKYNFDMASCTKSIEVAKRFMGSPNAPGRRYNILLEVKASSCLDISNVNINEQEVIVTDYEITKILEYKVTDNR